MFEKQFHISEKLKYSKKKKKEHAILTQCTTNKYTAVLKLHTEFSKLTSIIHLQQKYCINSL